MIKIKTIVVALAMFSSVSFLRTSSISPYLLSTNYLDNYITAQGSLITASSPVIGEILTQGGVNPPPSVEPSGIWALNQRKGNGGYYYAAIPNFSGGGYSAFQSDGSFGVLGNIYSGAYDALLQGFSSSGVLQWTWTFPGLSSMTGIVSDGNGGYYVCGADTHGHGALMHVLSGGISDPGFNGGAPLIVTTPTYPAYQQLDGIGLQSTGNIVVAGTTGLTNFSVSRILPNGTIDGTFATSASSSVQSNALAVDSQDRILVAGRNTLGTERRVYRFQENGGLDTAFGGGAGYCSLPADVYPQGLLVLSDNSVIVVGYLNAFRDVMRVVKITAAGVLDMNFGAAGVVSISALILPAGVNRAYSACSLPNGKIAVVGTVENDAAVVYFGIVVLNSDGNYDTTFTIPGQMAGTVPGSILVQPSGNSYAYGVGYQNVIGSTGLVVTGESGGHKEFGAVFYTNNN